MYRQRDYLSRLGIITVMFNPVRYRTRYERYRQFAYHMARSGVNLFTIECIFESATRFGLPPQRFEVTRPNNPQHFQVIAPSILWMKENLINIVVQQLPPHIDRIAWIDADVEFERLDWPQLTMIALDRYPIVQMFKTAYITGSGGKHEILKRNFSIGYVIRRSRFIQQHPSRGYFQAGSAWAMHRSVFSAIGGLLDFCIVGSDDLHFAYALLGRIRETFPSNLHRDYTKIATDWGDRVAHVAGGGVNVGYVDVNVYHRGNGSRNIRNHIARWLILSHYDFSPTKDLMRDEQSGVIYLTNKRRFGLHLGANRIEEMQQAIVYYFLSRDEDNRRTMGQISRMGRYGVTPVIPPHRHRSASPYAMMRGPQQQLVIPHRYYRRGFY
ncbi:hypothetical protein I4U23_019975 [Adineta vaga]|nr:hypothetical protein I4U23_019975 [Adineta vaga]